MLLSINIPWDKVLNIVLPLLTGASIVEIIKFLSPAVKRFFDRRKEADKSFYKNLDPILKSGSKLFGKLESLAKEDFSTFINPAQSNSHDVQQNKKYVYYLFAQFWGQIEYLRLESQYISLPKIKKGNQLLRFIETLESRKFRFLDRSTQRIIGECLMAEKGERFRIITLNEFIIQLEDTNSNLHSKIQILESQFLLSKDKSTRQKILVHGVIVAALIDHFDPKHKTVRRRGIYLNKLSLKSRSIIKHTLITHWRRFWTKTGTSKDSIQKIYLNTAYYFKLNRIPLLLVR